MIGSTITTSDQQPPSRRRGSIHDVARAAGVGVVTVSRVINGRPGVSDEMRAYVRDIIKQLNYIPKDPERRPGRKVRSDPSQCTRIIDLYIANPLRLGAFPVRAPIYSRMLDDLDVAATRAGIDLFVRQGTNPLASHDIGHLIGRIIFGMTEGKDLPEDYHGGAPDLPMVWLMGGDPAEFTGDSIRVDNERIGELAALTLHRLGHRQVGYLGTDLGYTGRPVTIRGDAFAWHVAQRGGHAHMIGEPRLIGHGDNYNLIDEAVMGQMVDRLMGSDRRPTALFLQYAMFAPSVYRHLEARGIRPGIDVAILVCNNDSIHLDRLRPRPLVIDIPCQAMAAMTVDLLVQRQHRLIGQPPTRHLIAPVIL